MGVAVAVVVEQKEDASAPQPRRKRVVLTQHTSPVGGPPTQGADKWCVCSPSPSSPPWFPMPQLGKKNLDTTLLELYHCDRQVPRRITGG